MASKKFSFENISEKNPLKPLIDEFKEVEKQLKSVLKLTDLLGKENAKLASETPLNGYKEIKQLNSALEDLNNNQKQSVKAQTELVKLTTKLNNLRDESTGEVKEQAVAQEKLKLQITESRKEAKRLADEALNGSNAYKQLTKQTNEAQAQFKKLAAQYGVTSKEAKGAEKQFNKLNDRLEEINKSAKDGRRDVGRYEKALDGAKQGAKAFGLALKAMGVGLILKGISMLGDAFNTNSEGALKMQNAITAVTASIGVFVQRTILMFGEIAKQWDGIVARIKYGAIQIATYTNPIGIMAKVGSKAYDLITGKQSLLTAELAKTEEQINKSEVSWKKLIAVYDGMNEEIAKKVKIGMEANKVEQNNILINAKLRNLIALNTKVLTSHTAAMDDDGNSLDKRLEANKEALKVQKTINEENIQIARNEEKLAKLRKEQSTNNKEIEAAYLNAVTERINAQTEASQAEKDLLREQSILRLDILDEELDLIIDDADSRKTVNEKIASDEKASLEDRQKAINDNATIIQEAFEAEEAAVNKFQNKKGRKEVDFTELLKMEKTEQMKEYLKEREVVEREGIRIIEIIKERRTFVDDLKESQEELNDVKKESSEIDNDIILQREALNKLYKDNADFEKILMDLDNARTEQHIENLQKRLEALNEKSTEYIALNQELNDALIDQQVDKLKKEKDIEDEATKNRQENLEKVIDGLEKYSDAYFNKRIQQIEEELSLEEKRQSELLAMANNGNKLAQENLDLTQKRQAELEQERQKQIKRQRQAELTLAAAKTYSAKVSQGDENAFASTVAEISLLEAFINSLPAFIEGTENVGEDGQFNKNKFSSGTDGYIARFDGDERILSPEQNNMIPEGMTNADLVRAAQEKMAMGKITAYAVDLTPLQNEMKSVKEEIRKKPVYLGMDFDERQKSITLKIKENNKLVNKHFKNKGF